MIAGTISDAELTIYANCSLSVNDAFVMRQWGLKQGCEEEKSDASNPLNPGNFTKTKLLPGTCLQVFELFCPAQTRKGKGEDAGSGTQENGNS
jgi:hypothetical protein